MPMNTTLSPTNLCSLAQELAEVAAHYQPKKTQKFQLSIHKNDRDNQDEIYVTSEDMNTGKKWVVVRVALTKLSEEERIQLNLQIAIHNAAITKSIVH